MLIYSNNLAEKLFGYAISMDFLKYSSPFCDLLDDPNLKIDFELAVNFNKALNGDALAMQTFTEDLIINGPKLDISTINFYVKKMQQYPMFSGEIQRVNYIFGNLERIPSNDPIYNRGGAGNGFADRLKEALQDCLNSPCNYFASNSESVGKLAQSTANMNTLTMPSIGSLLGEFATTLGGMGKELWNKIPEAFQSSVTELASIGQAAVSETLEIFMKDDLDEIEKKARSGVSLRGGAEAGGSIFTPDFKSYLDHSKAASQVLANISGEMGDCFRQFEHASRYNPYSANMNLDQANKSQVQDQSNGTVYERDITGQVVNNKGTTKTNEESLGISGWLRKNSFIKRVSSRSSDADTSTKYDQDTETIDSNTTVKSERESAISKTGDVLYEYTLGDNVWATCFGGWYDEEDPDKPGDVDATVWADGYEATRADLNTVGGVGGSWMGKYRYCPSRPGPLKGAEAGELDGYMHYLNKGWVTNENIEVLQAEKFNSGVALISRDVRKYLTPLGLKAGDCVAELTFKGKTILAQVIDQGGGAKTGTVALDLTPFVVYKLTNERPFAFDLDPAIAITEDGRKIQRKKIKAFKGGSGLSGPLTGLTIKIYRKGAKRAAASTSTGDGSVRYVDGFSSKLRNLPIQAELMSILKSTADELGLQITIVSGGQVPKFRGGIEGTNRTGSNRHDDGWAADINIYSGGRLLLPVETGGDSELLSQIAESLFSNGALGIGCGPGYMSGTTMHVDVSYRHLKNVPGDTAKGGRWCWGRGTTYESAPTWLKRVASVSRRTLGVSK